MSCKKCNEFQKVDYTSFYRWKNADIEIRGCPEHLKEIFQVLNKEQSNQKENEKKVTKK